MTIDFALQECRDLICALRVGERVTISRMMLKDVKTNWLILQSPVDRILEGIVGSSYEIRYWTNPETGDVTFSRVKGDGRKWNEPDPDRRHWFERGEDGALYPKKDQQIKIGIDLGSDEKTENQGEVKP